MSDDNLTPDQQAALAELHETLQRRHDEFQSQQELLNQISELLKQMTSLFHLEGLKPLWEERMKAVAAEILKPGSDEVIEDMHVLDYIWGLPGDRSWSSEQKTPFRPHYIEYFLGRKVQHVWGTGVITKMKNGVGIRVRLPCRCGKSTHTVYAQPGCHTGAFCYVFDYNGKYLADLRNQEFTCDKCQAGRKR